MQLLLQVLNKDLTGEAAKPSITPDASVLPEGGDAFASFLENSEGDNLPEIALTPDVETSEPSLHEIGTDDEGFRQIGKVLPAIDGDTFPQLQAQKGNGVPQDNPLPAEANVVAQELVQQTRGAGEKAVPVEQELKGVKALPSIDNPTLTAKGVPVEKDAKGGANRDQTPDVADTKTTKPPIEETRKVIADRPVPLTPHPAPDTAGKTSISPQFEKPEHIVSRQLVLDRGATDKNGNQPDRPIPIQRVLDSQIKGQQLRSPEVPLTRNTKEEPVQTKVTDSEFLGKDIAPGIPAKVTSPVPATPSNRLVNPRIGRSTARESTPETTVTITTTPKLTEPTQTTQNIPLTNSAAFAKEFKIGSETASLKEDGPSQTPLTERGEVGRKVEAPPPRIETAARPVITQVVHAAKTAVDGVIEVKLSPEELGRVRLAMTTGEAGLTVLVTAERQETLDLLRRNIDQFAADLAEQGFTALSFSFGEDTTDDPKRDFSETGPDEADVFLQPLSADTRDAKLIPSDGRLDLRL